MDSQDLKSIQEAYLDVYGELGEAFSQTKVPLSVRQNAEANRVGSKRFSDLGGHAALKAGGGQAALKSGSSVSNTIQAGRQALNTKSRQNFNNRVLSKPSPTQAKKPMDDFAAGGGNAKMKATGMTKDQVIAQGKKNLVNSYEPDLFDVILEYLVAEGYADTNDNALVIMANMSEEWRQNIVEAKKPLPVVKMKRKEGKLLDNEEGQLQALRTDVGSKERKARMKELQRFDNINSVRTSFAKRGGKEQHPMPEIGRYKPKDED